MNQHSTDTHLPAVGLCGQHLARRVSFTWSFPDSGVEAVVQGKLDSITHHSSHVELSLEGEGFSGSRVTRFVVEHDTTVTVYRPQVFG